MNSLIRILDIQAANQIAAGEVVERPVSVVKELVENALDAQAQHIEISIAGSGVERIRIRDDGTGILPEDLPKAVLRHATSKIRTLADLNDLSTLGFRGEALPSIASVAKVEIISRPKELVSGMLLRLEGGKEITAQEIGSAPGTTVTVEDLFYNTPARRKFLKSVNTEFGQISDLISRLALARPDVAFTLKHPQTVVFQSPGKGRLLESIAAVYGQETARRLIPVSFAQEKWKVEGYISPPDLVRTTRQGETLIVNGRVIRSKLLSRGIGESYHTLIPAKLFPLAILKLTLPPSDYDVNVHPTKMEIRFHKEKELAEFITTGLRQALLSSNALVPSASDRRDKGPGTVANRSGLKGEEPEVPASFFKASNPTVKPKQYALLFPRQVAKETTVGQDFQPMMERCQTKPILAEPRDREPTWDRVPGVNAHPSEMAKRAPREEANTHTLGNAYAHGQNHENKSAGGNDLAQGPSNDAGSAMAKPLVKVSFEGGLRVSAPLLKEEEVLTKADRATPTPVPGTRGPGTPSGNEPEKTDESSSFTGVDSNSITQPLQIAEAVGLAYSEQAEPQIPELSAQEEFFLSLRTIGQIFNTYILASDGEQLVLIDQHAAHERINYEQILEKHRRAPGASQSLLLPITLEFTPAEEQALLEFIMPLHDMGFVLEEFGTRTYLLRAIPASSGPYYGETILRTFLDQVLLKQIPPALDHLLQEWIYQLACKESIRAKERLAQSEMEQLLHRLSQTSNPYTCPHGRPTMIRLTRQEIEQRFYRH